jgi:hypothetical protein
MTETTVGTVLTPKRYLADNRCGQSLRTIVGGKHGSWFASMAYWNSDPNYYYCLAFGRFARLKWVGDSRGVIEFLSFSSVTSWRQIVVRLRNQARAAQASKQYGHRHVA